jgi:riboflavin biosynthesis pyrimidine reductase
MTKVTIQPRASAGRIVTGITRIFNSPTAKRVMHRPDLRASSRPISVVIDRGLNCNPQKQIFHKNSIESFGYIC